MNTDELIGKSHVFEDGNSITIFQIKVRDEGQKWVTYHIQQGPGIPRKLVLPINEFMSHYGHLFGLKDDDQ